MDSTVTLNDSTLDWAKKLQEAADQAQAGEQEAWNQLRTTRQEMRQEMEGIVSELHKHRQLAEVLTYRFRILVDAIMSPNASVDALQELVQHPSFGDHGIGG